MELTTIANYHEFNDFVATKLPVEIVRNILSYDITDKYNTYCNKYDWDGVEYMLYELMENSIDFCEHIFKLFRSIGDRLYIFYPNANNDPELVIKYFRICYLKKRGICLSRHRWFVNESHRGCQSYLDDEMTNYDDMIRMVITILQKFDNWYWEEYHNEYEDVFNCIISIYETLEKYIDMSPQAMYDDPTIEKATAYYDKDDPVCRYDENEYYSSDDNDDN